MQFLVLDDWMNHPLQAQWPTGDFLWVPFWKRGVPLFLLRCRVCNSEFHLVPMYTPTDLCSFKKFFINYTLTLWVEEVSLTADISNGCLKVDGGLHTVRHAAYAGDNSSLNHGHAVHLSLISEGGVIWVRVSWRLIFGHAPPVGFWTIY